MGRTFVRSRCGIAAIGAIALFSFAAGADHRPANGATGQVAISVFPVDGVCDYADTWHDQRAGVDKNGNPNVHQGVDIIAASGVPIRAVTAGKVTSMSQSTRGGNQLYLTQPDGSYFFHAHISRYVDGLAVGAQVKAGDIIAYVGQTGDAVYSTAHLHFEVHPAWNNREPINPYPVVRHVSGCGKIGTGTGTPPTSTPTPTAPSSPTVPTPSTPSTTAFPTVPTTNSYSGSKVSNGFDGFFPIIPSRIADSRSRFYLTRLSAMTENYLTVASRGSVPANASSVMLNLTITGPADDGWMQTWPCGQAAPLASNVNFRQGQTISNTALVAVGVSGRVCFRGSTGLDLVVDVIGWQGPGGADGFVPAGPNRLFDSRSTGGIVRAGETRTITVPATDGAEVTVTADVPSANGEIVVWPCAQTKPSVPGMRLTAGVTAANTTVVPIGASSLCVSPSVTTHIIVDLNGTWQARTGGRPTAITPVRLLDTRSGPAAGKARPRTEVRVPVAGRSGIAAGANAAQVNITVTDPVGPGFVTAWPCGSAIPLASVLNYAEGTTVANATLVGLGGGSLCLATSDSAHLIVDVTGYLA
jgi:Peptidase family M23